MSMIRIYGIVCIPDPNPTTKAHTEKELFQTLGCKRIAGITKMIKKRAKMHPPLRLLCGDNDGRMTARTISAVLGSNIAIETIPELKSGAVTEISILSLIQNHLSSIEIGSFVIMINNLPEASILLNTILGFFYPEIRARLPDNTIMTRNGWELDVGHSKRNQLQALFLS